MGMFKKKNLKEGSMVLILNKPFYICGDQVTGHLCLELEEEIEPFRIAMKLKGKEKTDWTLTRWEREDPGNPESPLQEIEEDHGDKKICFKKERTVFEQSSPLGPGQYQINFSFKLPEKIPGTLIYKRGPYTGVIKYEVTAKLYKEGHSDEEADVEYPIILREDPEDEELKKKKHEDTDAITAWCCIDKGKSKLKVYFEKDTYEPGDEAQIKFNVDNTECKVDLTEIQFSLVQETQLKDSDGQWVTLTHVVNEATLEGEKAGEKFSDDKEGSLKLTDPRSGGEYKPPKPKPGKKPKEKKGEDELAKML